MSQKNEILEDRAYVEIHMMQTIDGKLMEISGVNLMYIMVSKIILN